MQPVPEFMEKRGSFIGTQQGGFACRRLGKIANDGHNRHHLVSVLVIRLGTIASAPRTATLAGTGEEVEIQDAQRLSVLVDTLEHLCFGMRFRHVFQRTEGDAIQAFCHIESPFAHVVQLQIRTDFVFVHIIFVLFRFLEIITPVPAFGFEVLAFTFDFRLDVRQFLVRFGKGRRPKLVEQVVDVLFVLCHPVFQCHRSIIFIPHQLGFLQAGGYQLAHHFLVVGIVPVVSPVDVCLVDALAQVAVVGILQERHHAGILQGKHPLAFLSHTLGGFGGLGYQTGRQTAQVFLVRNDQLEGIGLLQHILPESKLEHRYFLVQFPKLLLVGIAQVGSAPHEILISILQQFRLFLVQIEFRPVVIHLLHALEQPFVQRNIIVMGRKQRSHLLAQRLHLGIGIATVLPAEHHLYPAQHGSAPVKCHNGILEIRHRALVDYRIDFLFLLFHPFQKTFPIIFDGNLLERRNPVWGVKLTQERIDMPFRPLSVSRKRCNQTSGKD